MAKKHTPREDQQNLPSTDVKNDRVHRAAKMYAKRRDERMAANIVEKEQHDKLMETMVEEGLDTYSYADVEVSINSSKKCRVVIGGDRKNEEEADEE